MKKVIINIVIVILTITVGFIFYQWHCSEMISLEKSQNELMAQRIKAIQSENDEKEKTLHEKINFLNEQIDELLSEEVVVFNSAHITEQLIDIGELATESYHYTSVSSVDGIKQFKFLGLKVPGSSKTALIEMSGVVKVGVDVTKIKIDTNEVKKTIIVSIPEAMIISNELFEETLVVHTEKEGVFNNITLADNSELRIQLKTKAEQSARDNGLFEQARENAGKYVKALIEAVPLVKDTYKIIIR